MDRAIEQYHRGLAVAQALQVVGLVAWLVGNRRQDDPRHAVAQEGIDCLAFEFFKFIGVHQHDGVAVLFRLAGNGLDHLAVERVVYRCGDDPEDQAFTALEPTGEGVGHVVELASHFKNARQGGGFDQVGFAQGPGHRNGGHADPFGNVADGDGLFLVHR